MARRLGLLPVAWLAACAQPAPAPAHHDQPRPMLAAGGVMPLTLNRSLGGPPRPASEAAPLPNRDIEAPPDPRRPSLMPSLEPLTLPQERPQGFTFNNELPRKTARDRPFEGLLQGARLRIPFE